MFTERAKSIRINGDPDSQRPDNWSSAVQQMTEPYCTSQAEDGEPHRAALSCTELRNKS
jgi:hypothetical protein